MQTVSPGLSSRLRTAEPFLSSLEPAALVETFVAHPPEGFTAWNLGSQIGTIPAFLTQFNILTTLDDEESSFTKWLRNSSLAQKVCTLPAVFAGTTVSEYAVFPAAADYTPMVRELLERGRATGAQMVIVKDIATMSPLLSQDANAAGARLLDACSNAGFVQVEGQALAYVAIDFASIEDYMSRMSHTRRKEMRRKLKSKAQIEIEVVPTGDARFQEAAVLEEFYALYLNVFEQSKYHFDKLTRRFFARALQDSTADGVVFVYKRNGALIGFNLCYVHGNRLVDKYVGFRYPDAREVNLYFVSWFTNLEYALNNSLTHYVAGWTDPEVKTALGAKFTFTKHAVYVRNPILRAVLKKFQRFFEPDANWAAQANNK